MKRGQILALATVALLASTAAGGARADDLPAPRLVPELEPPGKDQAQDPPRSSDTWSSRRRAVSVQGGSPGGPLGYGGLSFEYAPSRYFVTGAGAGIGPGGVTGALWPRLRLPITRWLAPGIGVPFSAGPYEYVAQAQDQCALAGCATGFRTARSWSLAFWGHIEPNI
ncbi:MAG TPA: hypothetical protein VLT33_29750, partial [Labilithrix sp.]|nr:hypothetical protein [Labilithrix sp.]